MEVVEKPGAALRRHVVMGNFEIPAGVTTSSIAMRCGSHRNGAFVHRRRQETRSEKALYSNLQRDKRSIKNRFTDCSKVKKTPAKFPYLI